MLEKLEFAPLEGPGCHNVIVTTPRLQLRLPTIEDAPRIHQIRNAPGVSQFLSHNGNLALEETIGWMRSRNQEAKTFSFKIELRSDPEPDAPSAVISFGNNDICQSSNGAEETPKYIVIGTLGMAGSRGLGYSLDPIHQGKGYATEAVKAWVIAYWKIFPDGHPDFSEEERMKITARVNKLNSASWKVLQKAGFECEKEWTDDNWKGEGTIVVQQWRINRPPC